MSGFQGMDVTQKRRWVMGFATANPERRWPGARIPFEVDDMAFPPGTAFHDIIVQAIDRVGHSIELWVRRKEPRAI
jgi:hypothetical protein